MFKSCFISAIRNLRKNKRIVVINVSGLAIGMASSILILLWVQNEFSYDGYHPNANRIYNVIAFADTIKDMQFGGVPFPLAEETSQIPGIEKLTTFFPAVNYGATLEIRQHYYQPKNAVFVDRNWFNVFHYDFVEGNALIFNKDPHSIILTQSLAKQYFGNKPALGEIIYLDSTGYQVQAVVRDNPPNSSFQFQLFFPLETFISDPVMGHNTTSWFSFSFQMFVMLQPGIEPQKIAMGLSRLLNAGTEFGGKKKINLIPLKKLHFDVDSHGAGIQHSDKRNVYIFMIMGALLLFIACINYVNLSTAGASLRTREVGIRKIIGADRKMLFEQFLMEAFLTNCIALILALLLVILSLPYFNAFTGKHFLITVVSSTIWVVTGSTFILSMLLTCIYPALLLSSFHPVDMLRGKSWKGMKNISLRKVLVVSQFIIAQILIISTIVIFKQMRLIQQQAESYHSNQVFTLDLPYRWFQKHPDIDEGQYSKTFQRDLKMESSIEHTTLSSGSIIDDGLGMGGIDWAGKPAGSNLIPCILTADAEFIMLFPLKLAEGRWFEPDNVQDEHNYILNKTGVQQLNLHKPYIGQWISFMNDTGHIIGIVEDFHFQSYHRKIGPLLIMNSSKLGGQLYVMASTGRIQQALEATEKSWKKFFPQQPFDYTFLDEEFARLYYSDRKISSLIKLFACIAIFISSLGLFGLTVFITEQRTKEIGIRKILGSSIERIVILLVKDIVKMILIAIIIASPIAWFVMNKWLQDFAYKITIHWWIFLITGAFVILIALVTVSFHTVKAAVVNPVKSLHAE